MAYRLFLTITLLFIFLVGLIVGGYVSSREEPVEELPKEWLDTDAPLKIGDFTPQELVLACEYFDIKQGDSWTSVVIAIMNKMKEYNGKQTI